jgi:hypothetical protein
VALWLRRTDPIGTGGRDTAVALDIDLSGADFTHPGWTVLAFVPDGAHLVGDLNDNDPRTGTVHHSAAGGSVLYAHPGSERDGKYFATVIWNDLHSGPMRVRGANLVAAFPDVEVENESSGGDATAPPPPTPRVIVRRDLQPGSDFAFLGGLPPDHQDRINWSWKPEKGMSAGGTTSFLPLTIEARSATVDEQSHSAEFLSGIFFGVAAAALIAATQEFMTSATKR